MNSMLQHNLLYNHRDLNLPPQTYTTAPNLAVTNPSCLGFHSTLAPLNMH